MRGNIKEESFMKIRVVLVIVLTTLILFSCATVVKEPLSEPVIESETPEIETHPLGQEQIDEWNLETTEIEVLDDDTSWIVWAEEDDFYMEDLGPAYNFIAVYVEFSKDGEMISFTEQIRENDLYLNISSEYDTVILSMPDFESRLFFQVWIDDFGAVAVFSLCGDNLERMPSELIETFTPFGIGFPVQIKTFPYGMTTSFGGISIEWDDSRFPRLDVLFD